MKKKNFFFTLLSSPPHDPKSEKISRKSFNKNIQA